MKNVTVREIHFYEYPNAEYSADLEVKIDDRTFCAQWSGDSNEAHRLSIPSSEEKFWGTEEDQDWASESIDCEELEKELENQGHENNFGYLEDNGEKI